ncbi:MAG: hypothetical protein ACK53Y_27775 [bacterium]
MADLVDHVGAIVKAVDHHARRNQLKLDRVPRLHNLTKDNQKNTEGKVQ